MKFIKVSLLTAAGLALFFVGVLVGGQGKTTAHSQVRKVDALTLGKTYKQDGIKIKESEYQSHGKNYVIKLDFDKAQKYDIGSNDLKDGTSKGVTVAVGNDQ